MSAAGIDQTLAYLQKVRRARHQHRNNPTVLHENLKRLSDVRAVPEERDVKAVFSQLVAESLSDGLLRYTHRTQFLRKAATMGISRFEANLLIAMEEHRAGKGWTPEREQSRRKLPMWVIVTSIQLVILVGIWWALFA